MPEIMVDTAHQAKRGRHKIYLGMAAGVGKTVRALLEIRDLRTDGVDAIVGLLETHGRKDTILAAQDLPLFGLLEIAYKGVTLKELDVASILERRPEWVMVDELAHTNAPGSQNPKRYMDVEKILENGINIISTLNVQHLGSTTMQSIKTKTVDPDLDSSGGGILTWISFALVMTLILGLIYPADLITTSGSGLDPDISPKAAEIQVARVALARGISEAAVREAIARHTQAATFGILGQARVNVLGLNLDLDGQK